MPGNFDNIIREVLNSTQSTPVGDVIPFDNKSKIQDEPPYEQIDRYRSMRPFNRFYDNDFLQKLLDPANEASLGSMILRS